MDVGLQYSKEHALFVYNNVATPTLMGKKVRMAIKQSDGYTIPHIQYTESCKDTYNIIM